MALLWVKHHREPERVRETGAVPHRYCFLGLSFSPLLPACCFDLSNFGILCAVAHKHNRKPVKMCEVNTQVIHALSYLCYKDFHLTSISPLQILVSCLKSIIPTILKPPGWHWKGAFLLFQGTFSVLIQVRIYFHLAVTRLLRVSTKWKDNYTMFIILKNLQQIDCSLKKKKSTQLKLMKVPLCCPLPLLLPSMWLCPSKPTREPNADCSHTHAFFLAFKCIGSLQRHTNPPQQRWWIWTWERRG